MSIKPVVSKIPSAPVRSALIAGEQQETRDSVENIGIKCIETERNPFLQAPVAFHPDMQICCIGQKHIVLRGTSLEEKLGENGLTSVSTHATPETIYPGDVLVNAFVLKNHLFGKIDFLDKELLSEAQRQNITPVETRQGYAGCSVCIVDENSIITADTSIASAAEKIGIDVLRIRPRYIYLKGYDTGFIGGCSGLAAKNKILFTGKLMLHPDGEAMKAFIESRNIEIIELSEKQLFDIGGIIPLTQ